jgi:glutamate-1-semialdehyde 2,1-aminomutase
VDSFEAVKRCDIERFRKFFHGMLAQGVYLAPSAYEACFVSSAHGKAEIKQTLIAAEQVFSQL